jgi:hypothetical protein
MEMSKDPAFVINHELRSRGLASLGEAGALIPQLAMFVRDHGHLRALLNVCEPQDRQDMYDALVPNLRFKARSLAEYLIELAHDAERRQLPTIGEDGQFRAFKVPELHSEPEGDDAIATAAAAEGVAKQHLHVVCAKCTREDVFHGLTKQDAVDALRAAGWRGARKRTARDREERVAVEICPECFRQIERRIVRA